MEILRDPLWQFIGIVIAFVTLAIAIVHTIRSRKKAAQARCYKRRRSDGLLLVGIASDFLYKFPVAIGALAANGDNIYTPENFGANNWLDVFKRLIKEEYFEPVTETAMESISLETKVRQGPKFERYHELARGAYRRNRGLDDD